MGDDETDLAPTLLGEVPETEVHQAWALDPDIPEPDRRSSRLVAAAVGAALLLLAGAGGLAVWQLRPEVVREPVVVAVPAESARDEGVAAPTAREAPPVSPPVASPPDVVVPPSGRAVYDTAFLEKLAAAGWYIRSPSWMTQRAHQMCEEFDLGTSPERVYQKFIGQGMSTYEAIEFMNLVTQTYPGCG